MGSNRIREKVFSRPKQNIARTVLRCSRPRTPGPCVTDFRFASVGAHGIMMTRPDLSRMIPHNPFDSFNSHGCLVFEGFRRQRLVPYPHSQLGEDLYRQKYDRSPQRREAGQRRQSHNQHPCMTYRWLGPDGMWEDSLAHGRKDAIVSRSKARRIVC